METGFLNFHDEEHFSTENYEQSNGFESENSLFGNFMADYNGQFDALPMSWNNSENVFTDVTSVTDVKSEKEDFQKTFLDWQQHISDFEPRNGEVDKRDIFCEPVPSDLPDIFGIPVSLPTLEDGEIQETIADPESIIKEVVGSVKEDPSDEKLLTTVKTETESRELDIEDDCVDIETIGEETAPVLEAGDLTTLLEQFEASEAVNGNAKPTILPVPVIDKQIKIEPKNEPTAKTPLAMKSIRDVLPQEVIDRIKESAKRRKSIALVPPARMPPCKNTVKQEPTSTHNRNKIIKVVGGSNEESVQLDHDYCSNPVQNESNNFYSVDKGDKLKREDSTSPVGKEKWKNVKKDSGLESAENSSDASEGTSGKNKQTASQIKPGESLLIRQQIKVERFDIPMVSVLKPICDIKSEPKYEEEDSKLDQGVLQEIIIKDEVIEIKQEENQEKKKKKLNLEEYRKRRKNMDVCPSGKKAINQSVSESEKEKDERVMVNAEVQTQENADAKKEESREDKLRAMALEKWGRKRIRSRTSSTSSSSSGDSRSRSRRRAGSKRYNRNRKPRSVWSGSRSRSRSRSLSSSSYSIPSSSSRSRSRSHSRGKQRHKSRSSYRRSSRRSPRWSPQRSRRQEDWDPAEKQKQVEERRVVYVGRIEDGITKLQLRERFCMFGPIVDITLHFRERGDNYGFVTFLYKVDAYEAVEHGNDNPLEPHYDICFGGRRAFCKQRYSDLDRASPQLYGPYQKNSRSNESFDALLREAQENLRKRSFV